MEPADLFSTEDGSLLLELALHLPVELTWHLLPTVCRSWRQLVPQVLRQLAGRAVRASSPGSTWRQLAIGRGWLWPAGCPDDWQRDYLRRLEAEPSPWAAVPLTGLTEPNQVAMALAAATAGAVVVLAGEVLEGSARLEVPPGVTLRGLPGRPTELRLPGVALAAGARMAQLRLVGGLVECGEKALVTDCQLEGSRVLLAAGGGTVQHCQFEGGGVEHDALEVAGGGLVCGNKLAGYRIGVVCSGAATVRANQIMDNEYAGVRVLNASEVVLEANQVLSNGAMGVVVQDSKRVQLNRNRCDANGHAGLAVHGVSEVDSEGDFCCHNKKIGLLVQGEARCQARGLTAEHNTWCGVLVSCNGQLAVRAGRMAFNAHGTVGAKVRNRTGSNGTPPPRTDGTETGSSSLGSLRAWGGAVAIRAGRLALDDCEIEKNHWHGVVLSGESNGQVRGCRVREQARTGVSCEEAARGLVVGGLVEANKVSGVVARGAAELECRAVESRLNVGSGFVAQGEAKATLVDNRTNGNTVAGIGVTGSSVVRLEGNSCGEEHGYCNHGVLVQEQASVVRSEASCAVDGADPEDALPEDE